MNQLSALTDTQVAEAAKRYPRSIKLKKEVIRRKINRLCLDLKRSANPMNNTVR